jgi:hypothetical protein
MHAVNSDGSDSEKLIEFQILDDDGKPCVDPDGNPVVMMLKPISQARYRKAVADNTDRIPARKGQPPREETDWDGVQDELSAYSIQSWSGVIGADDKPLACVYEAKIKIPGDKKNDIVQRAMQGEAISADSFRSAS